MREAAGAIGDAGDDAAKPSIGSEAALDDPADERDVDISTRKAEHDLFAGKAERRLDRRQRNGAGAFDDGFLQLQQSQNGSRDLCFIDEHDLIDDFPRDLETKLADL